MKSLVLVGAVAVTTYKLWGTASYQTPLCKDSFKVEHDIITDYMKKVHPYIGRQTNLSIEIKEDLTAMVYFKGASFFKNSNTTIQIRPDFCTQDTPACAWALLKQVSKIDNNVEIIKNIITNINTLFINYFSDFINFFPVPNIMHEITTFKLGYTLPSLHVWFDRHFEQVAIDFAIQQSTNMELLGGRRYLIAARKVSSIIDRSSYWQQIQHNYYERYIDFSTFHPPYSDTIAKIEVELVYRGATFNKDVEDTKANALIPLWKFPT